MLRILASERLETRGSVDHIADHGRIHTALGSDCPHDHTSCIDTDTDIDIATHCGYLEFFDELLDLDCGMESIICMVIVEYSEDTISEVLVDIAMTGVDDLTDPIEVDIQEEECPIWICDRLTHGRELHDIEEHDGESFSLSSSEDDLLISAESDLGMDLLRDESIEHLFEVVVVFFEELVFDVCPLKKREELGVLREFLIYRHLIWISLVPDKIRKVLKELLVLTPVSSIDKII